MPASAVRIDPRNVRRDANSERPVGDLFACCRHGQQTPRPTPMPSLVLSMRPVVYYRMEDFPKGRDKDTYVLVDSAPEGHHGEAHLDAAFGRARGRFGRVLDLHGTLANECEYAIVPNYPCSQSGQLSVSAWVLAVVEDPEASIAQNWGPTQTAKSTGSGQFWFGINRWNGLSAAVRGQDGVESRRQRKLRADDVAPRHVATRGVRRRRKNAAPLSQWR